MGGPAVAVVTTRQLLEAGMHFGHQTRRWNPKMRRFILGERNGIYIIDLKKTLEGLEEAYGYVRDLVANGGILLFVGHQEADPGPDRHLRRGVRHAVRQRAVAGRDADQLHHHLLPGGEDARVRGHGAGR